MVQPNIKTDGNPAEESKGQIRVLLADDHPLLRQALRNVLESQPDIVVVAEAGDGEEAVRQTTSLKPDVVIMDISMPILNGLEATRQIKACCPDTAILVLTVHDSSEHILGILEAGAAGYLTKSVFSDTVILAVRGVAAGETVLTPEVSQRIMRQALRHGSQPILNEASRKLTHRELEILKMARDGLSNKEIAEKLNLSLRTIKGCFEEIFTKLDAKSRTEAVIMALRSGLINLSDVE